ncbi:daunorubicin resistance protein DrrA family ABC transporter ATP-binding protein [Actinomadura sp. NBRC 104412]|uniref:ATP-binding cassette domain-containing protein n=1 Tax=Actinomadura sp. NBRC 104412 TaxID=3032203 RepID=UPI0024A39930|nr:ATP-binding cassette domain-containing protein [Actinomadura sp. NBRC 104412]GLZ03345.1 daunorubicin resistance protein DrrA family ABC transporter ATP-binding protein [Actinomadura sp. NBRC 104412]
MGESAEPIVVAEGLHKSFGETRALRGVDLAVPAGTVCGVLGPNGAGKTTLIRILATLSDPDAGTARIAGHDVVREAGRVRELIGLAGQYAAVDEKLTGRDNLRMFGRLYHLPRAGARRRADELLERFGLMEAADRQVAGYSGGMRRRLDLITSLILRPRVLFLDEPTTGLDPRSRSEIWEAIRELVADGTTVLLTTQYLDEADQLAGAIVVVDHGRVIAEGTPDALKAGIGDRLDVALEDDAQVPLAARVLGGLTGGEPEAGGEPGRLSVALRRDGVRLADVVRELDGAGVAAADVGLRRPTLDEVFLHLTGHRATAVPGRNGGAAGERAGEKVKEGV